MVLFPDDRNLAGRAHSGDADKEMLYKQAGMYFKGTRIALEPSGKSCSSWSVKRHRSHLNTVLASDIILPRTTSFDETWHQ